MDDSPRTLGDLLRDHRTRAGLTQAALATRSGLSVRALRDMEHDRIRRPGKRALAGLVSALDLSPRQRAELLVVAGDRSAGGAARLHVGVLGPLTVRRENVVLDVGPFKQRLLLGLLAVHAGGPVRVNEIVEALWPDRPPRTYPDLIHTYVARLRGRLAPRREDGSANPVQRVHGGYRLRLGTDQLDLTRFEELAARAFDYRDRGEANLAVALFEIALRCWRGRVLADAGSCLVQHPTVVAVSRRRVTTALAYADLATDRGRSEVAAELLQEIIESEPLHEGLHARLMLALASAGQQAAALRLFGAVRDRLADELGVRPGPELRAAHLRVLRHDVPTHHAAEDGPRAARADTVGTVTPAHLPADVADFTGRGPELDRLDRLSGATVDTLVISAVTGAPGVGKTALAVHWAHRVAGAYPDGQLYIDLRGYSADPPLRPVDAVRQLLIACGMAAERIPLELEPAAATLRSLLAGRRMLVLLDNAASAEQVRPLLPGNAGCLVLVTSRDRLDGLVAMQGARRVGLDVLDQADATRLLARIVGADRVRSESDAAAELTRLCGRLPLALRIAAAHLAASGEAIADYVAQLRDGQPVARLAVRGDERSAAVEAAFDRSYAVLSDVERRVFRLAGLAPGPDLGPRAAAALTGHPVERVGQVLDRLVAGHLMEQRRPGRYSFHDLLRLYARQRGEAEDPQPDRDAALHRLTSEYALATTAAARLLYPQMMRLHREPDGAGEPRFTDHGAALAWLDAERANLVAAVRAGVDRPWTAVVNLAGALRGYLDYRRQIDDWFAVARAGLAAAAATGDRRGEATSHMSLAIAHGSRAEFGAAHTGFTAVLRSARRHGWPDVEAVALNNLGVMYAQTGPPDRAAEHLRGALALYRRVGWAVGEGLCHVNLGDICYQQGLLVPATAHQTAALEIAERTDAMSVGAMALENLGRFNHALGRIDAALEYLADALERYCRVGNRQGESVVLNLLAGACLDAGDHARAAELAGEAFALAAEIEHGNARIEALNTLGRVHLRREEPGPAAERHAEALVLAGELRQGFPEVEALIGLAAARCALGEIGSALRYGWRALMRSRRRGYRVLEAGAAGVLAQAHLACGRTGPAARWSGRALELYQTGGDRLGEARTLVTVGRVRERRGDARGGLDAWRRAARLLGECGAVRDSAVVAALAAGRPG